MTFTQEIALIVVLVPSEPDLKFVNWKMAVAVISGLLTCTAYAGQISVYLPQLTGSYTVGTYPQQYGGDATLIETSVSFHWNESVAPRYINYEIAGVMGAPVPLSTAPDAYLDRINFNGQHTTANGPGIAWGTDLNVNRTFIGWSNEFRQSYDPKTGEFYFGISLDTSYYRGWNRFSDISSTISAAFYNYYSLEGPVSFADKGFVFVESARVGLSSDPLAFDSLSMEKLQIYPGSEQDLPEPASIFLAGIAAAGMIATKRKATVS